MPGPALSTELSVFEAQLLIVDPTVRHSMMQSSGRVVGAHSGV